ncbi:MAG TPA: hypothetical protein VN837_04090 [Chloroflexota bacterium]|nr:hypothetical protein [Chloroflexota bacterium]
MARRSSERQGQGRHLFETQGTPLPPQGAKAVAVHILPNHSQQSLSVLLAAKCRDRATTLDLGIIVA